MTYRRAPRTWALAVTRAKKAAGAARAAAAAGVCENRLRQLANPMRRDTGVLDVVVALDVASAATGAGTPIFDEYRRRLIAAEAVRPERSARELAALRRAVRAACRSLLALIPDPTQETAGV